MKHTASLLIILFLLSAFAEAHEGSKKCTCRRHLPHLCAKHFGRVWKIESESDRYTARFMNDTLELIAPKGLTLWHKKKMKGNVTITYFARVMDEGHPGRPSQRPELFLDGERPEGTKRIRQDETA